METSAHVWLGRQQQVPFGRASAAWPLPAKIPKKDPAAWTATLPTRHSECTPGKMACGSKNSFRARSC